ncbi:MAG: RluA family pseudouridine synthase [Planctomycetes bacterium]|nr:RluA family pseudouridine synthase [Planctomycetota bacterium]MCB9903706.1 RluA family pseudouridine synthase [Planctomycetota bacterium]
MSGTQKRESWKVSAEHAGERLDHVLVERYPGESRARLQSWIKAGSVLVAGLPAAKAGVRLEAGQLVEVLEAPARATVSAQQAAAQLDVLHEDDAIVVVNKPAGLLMHSAPSAPEEVSLAELAAALYPDLPSLQGEDRPGIVHRLDRDTSGLVVIARTEESMRDLMHQFAEREVNKTYLALVHGTPRFDSDWIEAPIGRSPRQPDRQSILPEGEGRPAETFYEVLERYDRFAYLRCEPKTGRTHQIRVHLSSVDLPIVGDTIYRKRGALERPLPREAPDPGRQALHAAELAFVHPETGEDVSFSTELPEELEALRAWLEADCGEATE